MTDPRPTAPPPALPTNAPSGRWRGWVAAGAVLAVFGGVVALVTQDLRARLRAQVLEREGEVLRSVAQMEQQVVAELEADFNLPVIDQPLEVALHTSKLRGVVAVRLFESDGTFRDAVPAIVDDARLPAADAARLGGERSLVRFHPHFALGDLLLDPDAGGRLPMLEVNVPLPHARDGADDTVIAQYWILGDTIAAEFARLDARIARQAGVAFLAGAVLIGGSLGWAFRRQAQSARLLAARAEDLARANRELAQSARTSAIGAITAHLMHGLRNPLSGLEDFVAAQAADAGDPQGEWAAARESTRRLRSLINEVHAVLRDVHEGAAFAVTAGEMCAGLCERLQPFAVRRQVHIEITGATTVPLGAREASLGGLVLANLAQNALEITPPGGTVTLAVTIAVEAVVFDVIDHGTGLPVEVAADPFRPRRSSKPDGAGIGLAISRELARHAGGELNLVRTDGGGTVFRLRLPALATRPANGSP